ncbi:hypothetical protein JKF63_05904 [Porcisia hertigi]|uniref:Uncharacterized protein n=1 Tax=Porcisia hertigi TaxID=2761500 RepID=A0A836I840_9TRYP|nr:hypothetical protein JKF63_05904 [Porcisia hertigi]
MFEEALQKAPRGELVEHIRLQRELIQRLHRRVLELESSLEALYPCSGAGGGTTTGAADCPAPQFEQQYSILSRNAHHRPFTPIDSQGVDSLSGVEPTAAAAAAAAAAASTRHIATHGEASLGDQYWSAADDGAVSAPRPRRQLPHTHTEEKAPASFARLPSSQQPPGALAGMVMSTHSPGATPAPAPTVAVSSSTAASAALLSASSVDHPTVLEGIREINYVLAAHRAGRPALPLAVVEELENIRTRLLEGFKHTYTVHDRDDVTAQGAVTARQGQGTLPRGERARLYTNPVDVSHERRADDFSDASRVCPRWISPDSSRITYGTSPHPRLVSTTHRETGLI